MKNYQEKNFIVSFYINIIHIKIDILYNISNIIDSCII